MKIVYCFHSLIVHGGVEKIFSVKANYLVRNFGYDVTIILYNQNGKNIFFDLDKRINIIEIDAGDFKNKGLGFIRRQLAFSKYKKQFRVKLCRVLQDLKPDISISLGGNEFYILNKVKDGSAKLAEYHVTMGAFDTINQNLNFLRRITSKLSFNNLVKNISAYKRFIVLTNGDRKEWSSFADNVINIPNPQTFTSDGSSQLSNPVAIAVGRFEPEKQFDLLIILWKEIIKTQPQWQLKLKGSGSQKSYYEQLILEHDLQNNVFLIESSSDMLEFYQNASIYLMASKFEGFSLVMLEAMQCSLPIVAFNCKYGPSELITDGEGGYLIPPGDNELYKNKILYLIENHSERLKMGTLSKIKAENYTIEKVMNIWKTLFEEIVNG